MSCGCNGTSTSSNTSVERLTPVSSQGRGGFGVKVNADFVAGALVNQVIVFPPADSPPASLNVTFPLSPAEGQSIQVVAAGINVTVDGNTNNIAGSTILASGNAKTWTFARDAFDPNLSNPGTWYPES